MERYSGISFDQSDTMQKHGCESIYLDNNATTQPAPEVLEQVRPFISDLYANPSATYLIAGKPTEAIAEARAKVANAVGADPDEVIFTSGGSESANTAIVSALSERNPGRRQIITTSVDHSCVLGSCGRFHESGYDFTILDVDKNGNIDLDQLQKVAGDQTALITAMWVNNETGNIYPVEKIAEIAKQYDIPVHIDAVQALGKVPVNLHGIDGIDYASFSGHKCHGLKGAGALYVKNGSPHFPLVIGGGQEGGKRAGTENVIGIIAMGEAADLANRNLSGDIAHEKRLRDRFESEMMKMSDLRINGDLRNRVANTSNISFRYINSQKLSTKLGETGLYVSTGSACARGGPSHVLRAMGASPNGGVRFSFSRYNTDKEVARAVDLVKQACQGFK